MSSDYLKIKGKKLDVFRMLFHVILISLCVVWIFPMLFAFLTSFKSLREFYKDIWALPKEWLISNYWEALYKGRILEYFKNSVVITIVSIFFIQILAFTASYALARMKIPHVEFMILFLVALQLLPIETIIIPLYMSMSKLGFLGITYLPMIIAHIGWSLPGTILIQKVFLDTVPNELLESARIDGASEVKTLTKIVLPLMKGTIATCVVMNFTAIWGEMMWSKICTITTNKGIPLTVGLLNFSGQYTTNWPLLCAAIIMIILPLLIIFAFAQKYMVASLTAGSVKG